MFPIITISVTVIRFYITFAGCGTAVLCGLVMLFGALMVAIFIYRGPEYFANKVIIEDFFLIQVTLE